MRRLMRGFFGVIFILVFLRLITRRRRMNVDDYMMQQAMAEQYYAMNRGGLGSGGAMGAYPPQVAMEPPPPGHRGQYGQGFQHYREVPPQYAEPPRGGGSELYSLRNQPFP